MCPDVEEAVSSLFHIEAGLFSSNLYSAVCLANASADSNTLSSTANLCFFLFFLLVPSISFLKIQPSSFFFFLSFDFQITFKD